MPRLSLTRVVIIAAAIVVGYFIFSAANDILLSRSLGNDEEALRSDVVELHEQQAALEAIRDYLRTDEYIEGVARRVLGLVRPGESLVIVSSTAPAAPTPDSDSANGEDERLWWEELYGP